MRQGAPHFRNHCHGLQAHSASRVHTLHITQTHIQRHRHTYCTQTHATGRHVLHGDTHILHTADPPAVLRQPRKAMYTEGVAPGQWLPDRACSYKTLPLQKKNQEVQRASRRSFRAAWRRKEAAVRRAGRPAVGGAGPHRRRRGSEARRAGPPSASSMFSRQPSRSMSLSTRPSSSSVASRRGVRRRQAASMLYCASRRWRPFSISSRSISCSLSPSRRTNSFQRDGGTPSTTAYRVAGSAAGRQRGEPGAADLRPSPPPRSRHRAPRPPASSAGVPREDE